VIVFSTDLVLRKIGILAAARLRKLGVNLLEQTQIDFDSALALFVRKHIASFTR
jgi:hypothetical protein